MRILNPWKWIEMDWIQIDTSLIFEEKNIHI